MTSKFQLTGSFLSDDILLKDSKLRAVARVPARDHGHVYHWINNTKPLDAGEYDFIFHRDDFISSANLSRNGFDRFIESCLSRWPDSCLPVKKFRSILWCYP
jgi:hypothetical protein